MASEVSQSATDEPLTMKPHFENNDIGLVSFGIGNGAKAEISLRRSAKSNLIYRSLPHVRSWGSPHSLYRHNGQHKPETNDCRLRRPLIVDSATNVCPDDIIIFIVYRDIRPQSSGSTALSWSDDQVQQFYHDIQVNRTHRAHQPHRLPRLAHQPRL